MKKLIDDYNELINNDVYKIIFSNPDKKSVEFKKIVINKIGEIYQVEKYTMTQVFHENIKDVISFFMSDISLNFKQVNIWDGSAEYTLKRSDGNLYMISKVASVNAPAKQETHNREKNYILPKDTVIPPLVDIGVITKDGKIITSMYDKYKQINRFLELLNDSFSSIPKGEKIHIIDFGCGKSYLTFITYYYLTEILELDANVTGLDLKEKVIDDCNKIAQKYGYTGLHFEVGDIAKYSPPAKTDAVITLHACDTATDYALFNAVSWGAKYIFSVPCCQHEINNTAKSDNLSILMKYGIVKERISALMTDAVRGNMLTYMGYSVQLLEFVDMSHTPKNIMIRAVKSNISPKVRKSALNEVISLNNEFGINPTLYKLFTE